MQRNYEEKNPEELRLRHLMIEMLWWDHKKAVHKWMPAKLTELKQCGKEDAVWEADYFKLIKLNVFL